MARITHTKCNRFHEANLIVCEQETKLLKTVLFMTVIYLYLNNKGGCLWHG